MYGAKSALPSGAYTSCTTLPPASSNARAQAMMSSSGPTLSDAMIAARRAFRFLYAHCAIGAPVMLALYVRRKTYGLGWRVRPSATEKPEMMSGTFCAFT